MEALIAFFATEQGIALIVAVLTLGAALLKKNKDYAKVSGYLEIAAQAVEVVGSKEVKSAIKQIVTSSPKVNPIDFDSMIQVTVKNLENAGAKTLEDVLKQVKQVKSDSANQ